jgi:hypothetical protein
MKAKTESNFNSRKVSKHGKNTSSIRYETKDKIMTISTLLTRREQASS